ncbi:hypothetical protein [Flavisphingomonas formosensis]|uniref:hypothetical protein n=1 Tax=Flavisphingomonas formosensis TaxID=861534 RepID=UPI0012FC969B|nr:hypothetical protein [Sphingomonas formosensis]
MTTKSTHPTRRSTQGREMLTSIKREATTPRLAAAAGVLAVGAAALALWRKSEWRDEAMSFGRSMADRAQSLASRAKDGAKALADSDPASASERQPLTVVA